MTNRIWLRAFREGNRIMARNLSKFLREEFGWDVTVDDDEDRITFVESNYGAFDCSDADEVYDRSDHDLLNLFVSECGVSSSRLQKIDKKFCKEISSLGKYTKLPLPKDIKKESNNGTSVQTV